MSISVIAIHPGATIQTTRLSPKAVKHLLGLVAPPIDGSDFNDVNIFTGVVECAFRGTDSGIARDTLSFIVGDRTEIDGFREASATVSLASFAYDGPVSDALWAVDKTTVALVNENAGDGTAQVGVFADLAVRGLNGVVLRVNYNVFVRTNYTFQEFQ